jgi:hypothetical protein
MNVIVRYDQDADYVICSKLIRIFSAAIIVFPAWLEALFAGKELLCPQSFNLGPIEPISIKSQNIDKQIALRLADHIPWVVIVKNLRISMWRISTASKMMASGETIIKHKPPGKPSKITTDAISQVRDLTIENPILVEGSERVKLFQASAFPFPAKQSI